MTESPAYRTPIEDAAVSVHGFLPLDDAHEVTALPLLDANGDGVRFARLGYDEASSVASRLGGRLLTMAEVWAVWRRGVQLNPVTLWTKPTDTLHMRGLDFCKRHDDRVWTQLETIGWCGQRLVANAGKDWIHGASTGRARNGGWILAEGRAIQPGGPGSEHHGRNYTDYSQLTRVIRPIGTVDTDEAVEPTLRPWRDPTRTLGERAMTWTLAQMDLPEAEEQPHGSNAGPYVANLLAPCVRNGKRLGLKAGNYCCAGSSAAMAAALLPGETAPHEYRAGVVEAVADAGERFVPAKAVLYGSYEPQYGDELIWDRSVPGRPETSWWRHINRLERLDGQTAHCLDFNAGTNRCVTRTTRSLHDRFIGIIPNGQRVATERIEPNLTQLELDTARRLMAIADDVMAGRYGADAIEDAMSWRDTA